MAEKVVDLKTRLEERLGPGELRQRMDKLRRETGGLLDGRALLALVADEEGVTEARLATLSELDPSRPVFTRCVIQSIGPAREFQGRDRPGRLRKLKVEDGSGSLTLTLWDGETGLVEQLGLERGTAVRILAATLKETRFGREIQVGKTGFIVPEEPALPSMPSGPAGSTATGEEPGRLDARGVILAIDTTGRGSQKNTVLRLFDGTGDLMVTVPHDQLEPPQGLARGKEVEISAALSGQEDGRTVLRCDRLSRVRIL